MRCCKLNVKVGTWYLLTTAMRLFCSSPLFCTDYSTNVGQYCYLVPTVLEYYLVQTFSRNSKLFYELAKIVVRKLLSSFAWKILFQAVSLLFWPLYYSTNNSLVSQLAFFSLTRTFLPYELRQMCACKEYGFLTCTLNPLWKLMLLYLLNV